jgi:hypothetical protein
LRLEKILANTERTDFDLNGAIADVGGCELVQPASQTMSDFRDKADMLIALRNVFF